MSEQCSKHYYIYFFFCLHEALAPYLLKTVLPAILWLPPADYIIHLTIVSMFLFLRHSCSSIFRLLALNMWNLSPATGPDLKEMGVQCCCYLLSTNFHGYSSIYTHPDPRLPLHLNRFLNNFHHVLNKFHYLSTNNLVHTCEIFSRVSGCTSLIFDIQINIRIELFLHEFLRYKRWYPLHNKWNEGNNFLIQTILQNSPH